MGPHVLGLSLCGIALLASSQWSRGVFVESGILDETETRPDQLFRRSSSIWQTIQVPGRRRVTGEVAIRRSVTYECKSDRSMLREWMEKTGSLM